MSDSDFLDLEEPGDKGSSDELILGKLKTQDDLTKAYSELESEFTRKSQELSEQRRITDEIRQQATVTTQPIVEEDDDQLFFSSPAQAVEKVVRKIIDPLFNAGYAGEKEKYRTDPDFAKHESEIDTIVKQMPHLKTQPGIVGQLFKMVKGLHFDPDEYEKKVREKLKAETTGKVSDSLEGSSSQTIPGSVRSVKLSDDEKKVAIKFNPGIAREEAYKKYADKKAKYGGVE